MEKDLTSSAWLRGEESRWGFSEMRSRGLGGHVLSLSVLHSIHADVPTRNFRWCFRSDTFNNALLKCPWSADQPINDVYRDADDRRCSYAVAQDDTPVGIIVLEKPELGWTHQKTANDELRQISRNIENL